MKRILWLQFGLILTNVVTLVVSEVGRGPWIAVNILVSLIDGATGMTILYRLRRGAR